ncbi:MAG TPA: single-stranded DNA-binding protein [Acidothermaceae bacterium]
MNREHISQAELAGRLGQKPELDQTSGGVTFARLNIATSERYTDRSGEIREKTEWTRAVAWGDLAESIANRFDKGSPIVLAGAMRVNSYEKDGAKNRVLELHVDSAEPNLEAGTCRNEARLVGAVRSVESKTLDSGTAMTVLSVGTTTKQNGKDREDWHSVTLWGRTAESGAKQIAVGDLISVNGSIRHRSVPGADGIERRLSAIDGRQFQVLERAKERDHDQAAPAKTPDLASEAGGAAPPRARSRQRGKSVERDM